MHDLMIIFEWVIASSIMGSVLIGAILLTKALFGKKLGAIWHYYIWILLLIRLMVPYAPQSSFSIFNLFIPMVGNSVQTINDGSVGKNVLTYESKKNNVLTIQSTAANGKTDGKAGLKDLNFTIRNAYRDINLNSLVMLIWLTGAAAFLLYMIISDIRFWLKIKRQCQYADEYVNNVFNECMLIMNVHKKLPVLITKEVISPCIYGVIRPKLLLPYNLVDKVSLQELKYILLHELSHYKQKHILINCFAAAVKALHWFNPIIWYGFYRMRQDCELECDAYVLSHVKPEKRIEYGYTILHLLKLVTVHRMTPRTAGILSSSNKLHVKRRMIMISNFKRLTLKSIFVGIVLFALIGTTGLTNAQTMSSSVSSISKKLYTESSLLSQSKEKAVDLWAEGLSQRNGGFRYAILSNELKAQEYKKYNDMYWVIGGSSPWVVDYSIKEKNKIDNETYEYEIDYTMTDSTRTKYNNYENITVKKLGNSWFVIKHDNYDYMPDNIEVKDAPFSEVQPRKNDQLISKDREGTVNLWAEALRQRSGAFRFAVLSNELKAQEYNKYNDMNWVIGVSSPWAVDYSIKEKNKIDNETYEYEINYTMADSTNAKYYSSESITVKKSGDNWFVIKHDNYDNMPNIIKGK